MAETARAEQPRYPSFWNRVAGGLIGSCIVGVVSACFRYSMFAWLPIILGAIMAIFGWKVQPPEGIKDAARGVIGKVEKTLDHTADKLKDVRESMEAAKKKAELEAKELKATTARERELFAQKLKELDEKGERRKKELEEKFEEQKRSLAVKAVEKVVENRVEAVKDGLKSVLPSFGKPESSRNPNQTPARSTTPQPTFNAMCPYCNQMMRVSPNATSNIRCPRCDSIFSARRARALGAATIPPRRYGY